MRILVVAVAALNTEQVVTTEMLLRLEVEGMMMEIDGEDKLNNRE